MVNHPLHPVHAFTPACFPLNHIFLCPPASLQYSPDFFPVPTFPTPGCRSRVPDSQSIPSLQMAAARYFFNYISGMAPTCFRMKVCKQYQIYYGTKFVLFFFRGDSLCYLQLHNTCVSSSFFCVYLSFYIFIIFLLGKNISEL